MLIIRRSKLYYTAYGIITPVGGRPVHRLRVDCGPLSTCAPDAIRRSKLYYTASGIITPVGGRPVHRLRAESALNLCTGRHQEVKIVLYSIWYHHTCRWPSGAQVKSRVRSQPVHRTATYRCDDTRCCIIQF